MYSNPVMLESIKKVEAAREANIRTDPRRMTAEEKDVLLKTYHPDYRAEQFVPQELQIVIIVVLVKSVIKILKSRLVESAFIILVVAIVATTFSRKVAWSCREEIFSGEVN